MSGAPLATLGNKIAVVTGAGRGIGAGVAQALLKAGASAVLVDRDEALVTATAAVLGQPPTVVPMRCDVADRGQVDEVVRATVALFGTIDIVVNCAQALRADVALAEASLSDLALALDSGLWGTFHFMQACYPHLADGGGTVVNFGSSAGTHGQKGLGTYAAAKEAIRGLSRVAALEWGRDGITVNVVCPSVMSPPARAWAEANPDIYRSVLDRRAVPRDGDAVEDVGGAVVFLAGPAARFITGETLMVNGGGSMRP